MNHKREDSPSPLTTVAVTAAADDDDDEVASLARVMSNKNKLNNGYFNIIYNKKNIKMDTR